VCVTCIYTKFGFTPSASPALSGTLWSDDVELHPVHYHGHDESAASPTGVSRAARRLGPTVCTTSKGKLVVWLP